MPDAAQIWTRYSTRSGSRKQHQVPEPPYAAIVARVVQGGQINPMNDRLGAI
jgi:hypothetical protein